jgi:O-antigen/teichoic acid export membrane protein
MLKRAFGKLFQNRNQTWTFYAQMARLLSGFAFIGLLARILPSELLGTWYIFVSLFGVASLVEMGLGQVIGRHAAYLKADFDLGRISSTDFLKFAKVGERFYLFLISAIGLIAVPIGLWWLGYKRAEWNLPATLTVAWLVYVCGGMLTILGTYYAALVNGAGQMWKTQRAAIFAAGMSMTVLLSLLVLPGVLLIPAIAMLLSQLLLVVLLRKAFFKLDITKVALSSSETALLDTTEAIHSIAKDAAKMLLIMASYQLLTNGFMLVLSKYISHQELGSYGLTMQLTSVVMSLSMIWSQSNFFEMAATRQSGNTSALRKIFFSGLIRALGIALFGMFCIYFLATPLLELIDSKTGLLRPLLLMVVLGSVGLEFVLTQFSQLLISRGDMRVAYLSLLAALTISGSTILLLSGGYSLITVFITRIVMFSCFIGIPVLIISRKLFRVPQSSTEVLHEAA